MDIATIIVSLQATLQAVHYVKEMEKSVAFPHILYLSVLCDIYRKVWLYQKENINVPYFTEYKIWELQHTRKVCHMCRNVDKLLNKLFLTKID